MNTIIDPLLLRRPRIEYVSPPICPFNFSASGVAFIEQTFDEDEFCPMRVLGDFLNFDQPSDGLAYNVYSSTTRGGILTNILSGLPASMLAVYNAGIYWITANTSAGESLPFSTTTAPGGAFVQMVLPPGGNLNLYKNGVKIIAGFSGTLVEAPVTGWYMATKITTDGESPLVTSCGVVLITGLPGPPPPPPCPGPDWSKGWDYGVVLCLRCLGVVFPGGIPNCSGGFSPPSSSFNALCQLIGGPSFGNIINLNGILFGSYTGPNCTSALTLTNVISGTLYDAPNYVVVYQDNVLKFAIGNVAGTVGDFVNGTTTYNFSLVAGVNSVIKIGIQQGVGPDSSFLMSGSFQNTCIL